MGKFIEKETIKQTKKLLGEANLKALAQVAEKSAKEFINTLKDFIDAAEVMGYTNEQWFINFEDELNMLSHKDHNKA